jgi:hypothetical protein
LGGKKKKDLAQQFGFGTGGALGSKFTESLCRYLYNLKHVMEVHLMR